MKEIIKDKEEKEFTYPCLMQDKDGDIVYVVGINSSGLEVIYLTGGSIRGERKIVKLNFVKVFEGSITLSND